MNIDRKYIDGEIEAVDNLGTMVNVWVKLGNSEMLECICMDHRMFQHMIEAEGDIIGREIEYLDGNIYFKEEK